MTVVLSGCFLLKPNAPELELKTIGENSVTLSWTEESHVDGFKIYREKNGAFTLIAQVDGNARSYIDKNLSENATYTYKMLAYKFGISSDWSNTLTVKTCYHVFGHVLTVNEIPLGGVAILANGIQETLTDEKGEWRISNLKGVVTLKAEKNDWAFTPSSVKVSSPKEVNFIGIRLPGIPSSPYPPDSATSVATNVTLKWSCIGSQLKYDIYIGTTSQSMKRVAIGINLPSYSPSALKYDTTYYWKVSAWNSAGRTYSPVWRFTTVATPISIGGYVKNNDGKGISNVEIKFSNGVKSVYTDSNGYWYKNDITGSVEVIPYKYRWEFTPSSTIVSSSRNDVNFKGTYLDQAPLPPTNPFPSNGAINVATDVTLKWVDSDPDGDALTYSLYFGTTSTPPLRVSNLTTNSYTVKGLSPSTTYYWKITASDGIKSTSGQVWSFKTKTITPSGTGTVSGRVEVYTGKSAFVSSNRKIPEILTIGLPQAAPKKYVPHEVVVGLKKKIPIQTFGRAPFAYKIVNTLKTSNGSINAALVHVSTNVNEALKYFRTLSYVKYAEPNYIVHVLGVPNDTYYSLQWNLPDIDVPQAWQITKGANTVIVAVLDTGVSSTHPDLQDILVPGYNFVSDSTNTEDDFGHGTHVAGIIDADTDNSEGVAGVDWGQANSVKIMPIKVLDSTGSGSTYWIAQGIVYATTHGAKVINMSLGGADYSSLEEEACTFAYDNGVTLVAAAGNDGLNSLDYPAAFSTVIPVSAVGPDNSKASYSNYSSNVLWAPGGSISSNQDMIVSTYYSTATHSNTYAYMAGTSMASPHVSAIIALMISKGITGPANIRSILEKTAQSVLASQNYGGYGLVNAYDAVTYNGGWEPMIVWAENANGTVVASSYASEDGTFTLTLPVGTYKIYAWQDFNSDNEIDTGDFYGYVGYYGNVDNAPLNVNITNGASFNFNLYVSPKIDNLSNPFVTVKGMRKLIEFKKRVIEFHYER